MRLLDKNDYELETIKSFIFLKLPTQFKIKDTYLRTTKPKKYIVELNLDRFIEISDEFCLFLGKAKNYPKIKEYVGSRFDDYYVFKIQK